MQIFHFYYDSEHKYPTCSPEHNKKKYTANFSMKINEKQQEIMAII